MWHQCITFQNKFTLLFTFDEFWKSQFPFNECKFWPASSHHCVQPSIKKVGILFSQNVRLHIMGSWVLSPSHSVIRMPLSSSSKYGTGTMSWFSLVPSCSAVTHWLVVKLDGTSIQCIYVNSLPLGIVSDLSYLATFKRLVKTELYNRAYLRRLMTTRTNDSSLCEWLNVRHQPRNNNNNNNNNWTRVIPGRWGQALCRMVVRRVGTCPGCRNQCHTAIDTQTDIHRHTHRHKHADRDIHTYTHSQRDSKWVFIQNVGKIKWKWQSTILTLALTSRPSSFSFGVLRSSSSSISTPFSRSIWTPSLNVNTRLHNTQITTCMLRTTTHNPSLSGDNVSGHFSDQQRQHL